MQHETFFLSKFDKILCQQLQIFCKSSNFVLHEWIQVIKMYPHDWGM